MKAKLTIVLVDFKSEGYGLYPFGLYVLRSYAMKRLQGIDIRVMGYRMETEVDMAIEEICALAPDVVGFTTFVWSESKVHTAAIKLRARSPRVFTVLGGPQIEAGDMVLAKLINERFVNAAVVGEGEAPFVAILEAISNRDLDRISEVPGVSTLRNGGISWAIPQIFGKEFEDAPNPVVDDEELLEIAKKCGVFVYESARGCPYLCTFCDQGAKSFRSRPASQIAEDLRRILDQRPRKIVFLDSTFNVSPARTRQLLMPIIDSGIKVEIEAEVKPERCDRETVEWMRQAGFKNIEVGLQSIKAGTLQFIKRNNDFPRIEHAVRWLLEAGIDVHVDTIIGLPGETLNDWLETVDYCYSLGNVTIFSNTLKILPNAMLKRQIADTEFRYIREKNCAITNSDAMTSSDIQLAKLHQKIIKLVWNRSERKQEFRELIDRSYRSRLTHFTGDALRALSEGVAEEDILSINFWKARGPLRQKVLS